MTEKPKQISSLLDRYNLMEKKIMPASELIRKIGRLVYTPDQIYEVSDPLTILFRKTLVAEDIHYDYFVLRYREYCREVLGHSETQVRNDVNNINKTLYRKYISSMKFRVFMECIDLPIKSMTFTTIKNGELITFSSE